MGYSGLTGIASWAIFSREPEGSSVISVSIYTNEIDSRGQLVEHHAATFRVTGQEFKITEGDPRYVQLAMPVYSEQYGRLIDFDTDGEEWARNLPSAYRNGAMEVQVEEVAEHRRLVELASNAVAALADRARHVLPQERTH
jgi:hypothetical protein